MFVKINPVKGFAFSLFFTIFANLGYSTSSKSKTNILCPKSDYAELKIENHVTPYGNLTAGEFTKIVEAKDILDCIQICCNQDSCDVVFMFNLTCYLITCNSDKACTPLHREGDKFEPSFMVQIRSADFNASYLTSSSDSDPVYDDVETTSESSIISEFSDRVSSDDSKEGKPLLGMLKRKTCIYGLSGDCPQTEHCVAKNSRARNGLCECNIGLERDSEGICQIPRITSEMTTYPSSPSTVAIKHLVVSAGDNKILYLPENSATLSAFAIPKPPEGESYKFEWTLVSHPEGDEPGAMENQNTPNLKLSKLSAGVYTFKVLVTGQDSVGENQVNVTVLPTKHANKPPVAIIQPDNVTVQLPNRDTVLDGSFSKDYNQIVKHHWEAVAVPIGYTLQVNDTPTLQLKNLIPGFYRFKLTVTDNQNASNFTYANVTVLKESDYPPTANAGDDIVIYLPKNEVTLNGNSSTDDKGIKSWQWQQVKSSESNQPADVEGTTSPLLHLSHLDVGVYKFQLKVTDTADQTSVAEVRVFVKPENHKPPTANPGPDQKVALPLESPLVLDGSGSSDGSVPVKWLWEQLKGPKPAKIEDADKNKCKLSNLVPGEYTFKLTVFDSKGINGSATVNVSATQLFNSPPKAVAGGDKTVFLPCGVVALNGSLSSDDVEILTYKWTREPSSLAVGDIVEDSANKPILKLVNLIPGRYLFRLTVADAQGAIGTDTTSLIVKSPPNLLQQVEMIFNADIKAFTHEQLEMLLKQLELLVHDGDPAFLELVSLSADQLSRRVTIIFVVKKITSKSKEELVLGPIVVARLKHKLRTDSSLLNLEVLTVHTVVCQNDCSSHGSCDPYTKRCICEAFWMENWFKAHFGDQESNCDWSILYVIIVFVLILVSLTGGVWAMTCFCSRMKFKRRKRRPRYMLLEEFSDKEKEPMPIKSRGKQQHSSVMVSESDSDTVFESRMKPLLNANGVQQSNGNVRKVRA